MRKNWLMSLAPLAVCLVWSMMTVGEPYTPADALLHPSWVVNAPSVFHHAHNVSYMSQQVHVNESATEMSTFADYHLARTDGFTDGEIVDVLEHFFWGRRGGLAMELGALDGSAATRSMTFELAHTFGWHRILVEGNPSYAKALKMRSPTALSVNAAVCASEGKVHYSSVEYIGGILEFMSTPFLKQYHPVVFAACTTPGNLSTIDWNAPAVNALAREIDCIPLAQVLRKAHARHINFFVLDVEGGEMNVLQSIDWTFTRFDVLCIETDPENRAPGYRDKVAQFLAGQGYVDFTGQVGRNTWFVHKGFVPSAKPGLPRACFNGARKSAWAEAWWVNRKVAAFKRCEEGAAAVDVPTGAAVVGNGTSTATA